MLVIRPMMRVGQDFALEPGQVLAERSLGQDWSDKPMRAFASNGFEVIHPGTHMDVATARLTLVEHSPIADVSFQYRVLADGDSREGEQIIPGAEIAVVVERLLKR